MREKRPRSHGMPIVNDTTIAEKHEGMKEYLYIFCVAGGSGPFLEGYERRAQVKRGQR